MQKQILGMIGKGIHEILPPAKAFQIHPETRLSQLPEWDSMTSVNFKVFLEETFGVKIPDELLEGDKTIEEIIHHIRRSD